MVFANLRDLPGHFVTILAESPFGFSGILTGHSTPLYPVLWIALVLSGATSYESPMQAVQELESCPKHWSLPRNVRFAGLRYF